MATVPSTLQPASTFSSDSPNLDCLRSYAVLLVLVDHVSLTFNPALRGVTSLGFFGVLIFFVHTSLVLMLSLQRTFGKESRPFISFYIRRFFRIYPLSMVCVLLAVFSGYRALSVLDLWSNLTLTMNFTLAQLAMNPLWSLPYEVQMYLLLPFLFLFVQRFRSVWATLGLFLPLTVLALIQPQVAPKWDIVQYAGCFLPGILAYQLSTRTRYQLKWWGWPMFLIFTTLLFTYVNSLHIQPSLLVRWPACLLVGLAAPQFRQLPDGFLRRAASSTAKYSYGIYLTHIFSLHIAFVKMATYPWWVRVATCTLMMFAFPFLAYVIVEHPGIDVGKRIASYSRKRGVYQLPSAEPLPAADLTSD